MRVTSERVTGTGSRRPRAGAGRDGVAGRAAQVGRRAAAGRAAWARAGAALASFVLAASAATAQEARVTYLFSDGNLSGTLGAYQALLGERPDLRGRVAVEFLTESLFDDADVDALLETDVLVFDVMNQQMLERFEGEHGVDLLEHVTGRGLVLGVGEGLLPRDHYVERGVAWNERARAFWANQGFENQVGLLKQALSAAGVAGLTVPDPQPSLEAGYYYPDGGAGRAFATWEAFDAWRRAAGKLRPGAARVAVGFYRSQYYAGDTAILDAVIAEIERQGAEAIPVFGYPAAIAFEALLATPRGPRGPTSPSRSCSASRVPRRAGRSGTSTSR